MGLAALLQNEAVAARLAQHLNATRPGFLLAFASTDELSRMLELRLRQEHAHLALPAPGVSAISSLIGLLHVLHPVNMTAAQHIQGTPATTCPDTLTRYLQACKQAGLSTETLEHVYNQLMPTSTDQQLLRILPPHLRGEAIDKLRAGPAKDSLMQQQFDQVRPLLKLFFPTRLHSLIGKQDARLLVAAGVSRSTFFTILDLVRMNLTGQQAANLQHWLANNLPAEYRHARQDPPDASPASSPGQFRTPEPTKHMVEDSDPHDPYAASSSGPCAPSTLRTPPTKRAAPCGSPTIKELWGVRQPASEGPAKRQRMLKPMVPDIQDVIIARGALRQPHEAAATVPEAIEGVIQETGTLSGEEARTFMTLSGHLSTLGLRLPCGDSTYAIWQGLADTLRVRLHKKTLDQFRELVARLIIQSEAQC